MTLEYSVFRDYNNFLDGEKMERYEYIVVSIDGDYAHLKRIDIASEDLKLVARALLPAEINEGSELVYECFEYSMK